MSAAPATAGPRGQITLRPADSQDEPFLLQVYAAHRARELADVPWSEAQKQEFLRMQLAAQHSHYREHFRDAKFQVICLDNQPVGRLYVARLAQECRILDLAVLPEHRRAGVGSHIISGVLGQARTERLPVTVYVDTGSPSQQLFERFGFRAVEQDEFNVLMRCDPLDETR